MKVLFAVNNENISENIIKKYQQDYKQIISSKNVYYFNAIVKELQKDKTYDRIVISEDLEPFSNNNYDTIDKFIFEKMDSISDEATNMSGADIPIVVIATDRRSSSDELVVKLFGIGIYDVLLGQDRSITKVCELLNKPRTKKEAKQYYKLDVDSAGYESESTSSVSEVEIQNILNFYKKLGKNEEKYVESFNHIATQYTDSQLRLIAKFLPLNVKAVLESSSIKYQEVVSLGANTSAKEAKYIQQKSKNQHEKRKETNQFDILEKNIKQNIITEPVVVPKELQTNNVEKVSIEDMLKENKNKNEKNIEIEEIEKVSDVQEETKKRGRGRPKKVEISEDTEKNVDQLLETPKKRGRGRPRKVQPVEDNIEKLNEIKEEKKDNKEEFGNNSMMNLFELADEEEPNTNVNVESSFSDIMLPGLDDIDVNVPTKEIKEEKTEDILNQDIINDENEIKNNLQHQNVNQIQGLQNYNNVKTETINNQKYELSDIDLSSLLTSEKKIAAFVGTTKNGTSFTINNVAEVLSQRGIKTALVDLTRNKNDYFIYTENEEELRKIAYESVGNLRNGIDKGIKVNKNLTVFTSLPEDNDEYNDYGSILETLLNNYSLILLDCDFETNYGYFKEAQEIYLVQSLDILTIQPLTAFLRNLKAKNVLNPEKVRVVLNKVVKVRSLDEKTIIGGMAFYNDPAMSFMSELFNKDTVPYCSIPFEEQAYAKYLEGLVNCKICLKGNSKRFIETINRLADMVYPINKKVKNTNNTYNSYQNTNTFSNSMNDTLNKMKRNY